MIFKNRIGRLDENELAILMYSINNNSPDEPNWIIKFDDLHYLRIPYVMNCLSNNLEKIKPEYKEKLQIILDKLTKAE